MTLSQATQTHKLRVDTRDARIDATPLATRGGPIVELEPAVAAQAAV